MDLLPKVMRAVLMQGHGGFEQLDYRDDVAVPHPGHGEVLIRVGAAGINNTDINTRIAWYSKSILEGTTRDGAAKAFEAARSEDAGWSGSVPRFPRIQGADACGHIVAVGAGVDEARIGERVLVEPVFHPPGERRLTGAVYFGSECDGAFAQFAKVPAAHAYPIDSPLTDAELASFPCSYSAAENMLTRVGLAAGETVLVTGASGGVGSAAVQLALCRGATVMAVASPDKADAILKLGASRVFSRDTNLIEALGAESVEGVIDVVGGATFSTLLGLLKRGGRYAVAGAIAGPVVNLDLRTLYLKDLRLFGCTVLDEAVFGRLVGLIESGAIRPLVAQTFPLSAIVEAQTEFLAKRHIGKLVLIPPE